MTEVNGAYEEMLVPHVGWLRFPPDDHVLVYLQQSWFEFHELAFVARYLRPGGRVVDCGAHVGLYAILASHLVGPDGRVLAIEPNPPTFELLLANIRQNGAANVEARAVALGAAEGTATLSAPEGELAAYSSIDVPTPGASTVEVRVTTADRLLPDVLGDGDVAFMKIDVEGHEPEVWAGCRACAKRLDVVMVECSRAHLEPAGRSVADLFRVWGADGFQLHRYDAVANTLTPANPDEDVEWVNFFATRDAEAVRRRLSAAPAEQERIAGEIVRRGQRGFDLLKRACDAEHLLGRAREEAGTHLAALRAELASVRESADEKLARLEPLVAWRRYSRAAALLARLGRVPGVPDEA